MDLYFPFFYFVFVSCAALLLLFLLCSVKLRSSIRGVQRKTRDLFWAENMILVQNLIMERLRAIVNLKSWDYCVLWKLGDDRRFLEWLDCCCAGSENMIQNVGDKELLFPVSSVPPCRDIMVQHPRTKLCDLLANLPFSILLDSGIYAQALMSNQVGWLNFSNNSDSNAFEETAVGTRVLIPVPIGLVELFVAKQVGEDPQTIDFVTSSVEQAMINSSNNMDPSFSSVNVNELMQSSSKAFLAAADDHEMNINAQKDDQNLPHDISADRIRLSNVNSSMNFLQQFNNNNNEMSFFEGSNVSFAPDHEKPLNNNSNNNTGLIPHQEEGGDSVQQETTATGRNLESVSDCSDPNIEDELDDHHHGGGGKYRRRTGTEKGQAKNLLAERKRRRKLNDRLYSLRALVPNISKLDRASILGDAIEFVKELQKQVGDLQRELEDQSEDEGAKNAGTDYGQNMNGRSEMPNQNGIHPPSGSIPQAVHDQEKAPNGFLHEAAKQNHLDSDNTQDKLRQMEPQVEVAQLDGNEFFVKVFCEHKPGSLVRLMTTLNSLGLEVTNVNVTSSRSLVSNVFKVEKRDSEMVQADHVRESLLEITRNPYGGWPEITTKSENHGNGRVDYHDHDRHQFSSHHHHHHHHRHLHDQA